MGRAARRRATPTAPPPVLADDATELVDLSATWWHGGPRITGALVLPAATTGATPAAAYHPDPDRNPHRPDRVYLHRDYVGALLFAAASPGDPWIYECRPAGLVELDPDWTGDPGRSIQCEAAVIVRRLKPSTHDVALARLRIGLTAR